MDDVFKESYFNQAFSNQHNQDEEKYHSKRAEGIQSEIYSGVLRIIQNHNQVISENGNSILAKLKKDNDLLAILENIQMLIPRQNDVSSTFKLRSWIEKLEESVNESKNTIFKLQKLYYQMKKEIGPLRKKLNMMCEELLSQKKTKANIKSFFNDINIKNDISTILCYNEELKNIMDHVQNIQVNIEIGQFAELKAMQIAFFSSLNMKENNIFAIYHQNTIIELEQEFNNIVNTTLKLENEFQKRKSNFLLLENEESEIQKQLDEVEDQLKDIDEQIKESRVRRRKIEVDKLKYSLYQEFEENNKRLISEIGLKECSIRQDYLFENTILEKFLEDEKLKKQIQKKEILSKLTITSKELQQINLQLKESEDELSNYIKKHQTKKEEILIKLSEVSERIKYENFRESEYQKKYSKFYDEIGIHDQQLIDFWEVGIDGFYNLLNLLCSQIFSLERLIQTFSDISNDIIYFFIDESVNSSQLSFEGRYELINQNFFSSKQFNLNNQNNETNYINNKFMFMIKQICDEEFYIRKDSEDETNQQLAQQCILLSNRSLDIFFSRIDEQNQEKFEVIEKKKRKNQTTILEKSLQVLEKIQDEERNCKLKDLLNRARIFIELKVVSVRTLKEVDSLESIEKILKRIKNFNFKKPHEPQNKFDFDSDDEKERFQDNNSSEEEDDIIDAAQVKEITKSIQAALEEQIQMKQKHQDQHEMLEQVVQICETKLNFILLTSSRLQRSNQIDHIINTIQIIGIEGLDKCLQILSRMVFSQQK